MKGEALVDSIEAKADGLVVGSQLCKKITDSIKNRQNPVTKLNRIVSDLKRRIV